jgi:AraC-like DNA-binding protein
MEATAVRTVTHEISRADAIEHFLASAYGTSIRIRGRDGHRLLRHRRIDAGPVAAETAYQSADLNFEVGPLRKLIVIRTSTCRIERASDGDDRRYGVGEVFLMCQPDRPHTARWLPGQVQNCIIDPALLARVAASAPGRRPEPIRFTSLDPSTPQAAGQWWAARCYVADLLENSEAAAAPLVIATAARLLAAVTLATFPNNAVSEPTAEDRRDAHPAALSRAIAFIDEHADQDISVADIAAAAQVTVRSVQLAFRRHLDLTPMQYLRRVRLGRAHHDLVAADPARTSVTAVAYRWGFASSSRFATCYRQAYGLPPSVTLHQD